MYNIALVMLFTSALLFFDMGYASEQQAADMGHTAKLGVADFSDKSPSGQYYCETEGKTDKIGARISGWNVYLITKAHPERKTLIFETGRTAAIKWSPSDKFFAILDYADGHTTDIHVFEIDVTMDNGERRIAKEIYQSPTAGIVNSHSTTDEAINTYFWDVVSWDMSHGKIKIECRFREDLDNALTSQTYEIPLFLVKDKMDASGANQQASDKPPHPQTTSDKH